jgi:hypothetical protein
VQWNRPLMHVQYLFRTAPKPKLSEIEKVFTAPGGPKGNST